ncbi:MAG TPA: polysaccharide biosynthesis/export family protein [Bryobacteraceae bacterium]|jgi:polysaccharide export outer membrane protein|nr:polysaccharide biosynthesis/export family protein [Bryobacteraceae bacterium]
MTEPIREGGLCFVRRTAAFVLMLLCQSFLMSAQSQPAQNGPITPLGASQQPEPQKPAQITPPAGSAAPVDSSTYKVGPGDILNIDVWHEPQFTGVYTVHSDGKITLKLVGELDAGDKTPNQIQDIVKAALVKYVLNPLVTVTVQEVISKKYYLDGLANRPGEYALVTPTTVFEAISRAGGLQEFANTRKIYVLRGSKRIPFNYKEVIHGKHMEQNIKLEPGDHIVVP